MFVVYTDHPIQRARLEEEHASLNSHFYVANHQINTLVHLLRSISFQYYRGSPSIVAKKLTDLTVDSLNMTLSLTLFRQLMVMIKQYQNTLSIYESYFQQVGKHLYDQKQNILHFFDPIEQETSHVFEIKNLDKSSCIKFTSSTDFQQALQKQINNGNFQLKFEKSRKTGLIDYFQNILESTITKQKLDLSVKKILSFQYAEGEESLWWKNANNIDASGKEQNSSRSLIQYNYKGQKVTDQDSINQLIKKQAQFQKQREYQLQRKTKGKWQDGTLKLNKKMKEKLVTAKLKRRRRK